VNVFEEAEADAGMSLVPGDGHTKNCADLTFNAPVFEKIHDLTLALYPFPADMTAAGVISGSVQEVAAGVVIVTFFGKDDGHGLLFGVVKFLGSKERLWKNVDGG
jgi:hypothetical protein